MSFIYHGQMGSPPELPKRLRLVVDVSGSMYRFNGHDGRLWRQLEATLMMMEALESYEEKITVGEGVAIDELSVMVVTVMVETVMVVTVCLVFRSHAWLFSEFKRNAKYS